MSPEKAGDEPFMMARRLIPIEIPVIVGQNRHEAGMLAMTQFKPDVIILDDAFQHRKIERDIDLVLLDSQLPIGNKYLLPRGMLREPVSSLLRADAFVLTRSNSVSDEVNAAPIAGLQGMLQGRPVYCASHVPTIYKVITGGHTSSANCKSEPLPHELEYLKGRKAFAFSGLARNDDFRHTVESFDCDLRGFMGFPDHHWYSEDDFNSIFCSIEDTAADILLTTEKDFARFSQKIHFPVDLLVIGIQIFFGEDESAFNAFIKNRLEKH
jgi:tetraacyldisaccharide 4'-kinase